MAYSCMLGGKYSCIDRNMEAPLDSLDSMKDFGVEESKIQA